MYRFIDFIFFKFINYQLIYYYMIEYRLLGAQEEGEDRGELQEDPHPGREPQPPQRLVCPSSLNLSLLFGFNTFSFLLRDSFWIISTDFMKKLT